MMRKLHILLAGAYLYNPVRLFAAAPPPPPPSTTEQNLCQGANLSNCTTSTTPAAPGGSLQDQVAKISGTLLLVAGAVAVIIIIIGGLTYITANGDASRTKQAKDTILYAIIGVVVTIIAYAIVHFVATAI